MNRFDRITAILIQLQSKKVVKAQDLATRFGISLRTVYRDIRSLEEAGIPLYGEAGIGYSLVDGYRLPPVMFTQDEAVAFITAEKLMGKFSDAVIQQNFTSTMYKIKAVLRSSEKDLLENLENQIIVEDKIRSNTSPGNTLDVLLKAVADKKAVALTYRAPGSDKDSERLLEPIGVFHENEYWYTIGYCHLRDTYRQFRIDRVVAIALTITPQLERSSLQEYRDLKAKAKAAIDFHKIIIRLTDKTTAIYLQDQRHYYGFVSEIITDNYIEMTFLTEYPEGLARWYMMFADCSEVIEPESFKIRVSELLSTYLKKIQL